MLMGSPLGAVFVNVIMWYVDDSLLLVEEKDIKLIHGHLKSLDKNIKFTINNFSNGNVHFLDIQTDKNEHSMNKLKTSKNLCPGIHALNKYVNCSWKIELQHEQNKRTNYW